MRGKQISVILLCVLLLVGFLPMPASAASKASKPESYNANGGHQPVTPAGYDNFIDDALKLKLDGSGKDAIAVKNAYFESEDDRTAGIIKTDIAMLGDLPVNGLDVVFISDVSGSMSLFTDNEGKILYTCSCCNEDHYYCIPSNFEFTNGTRINLTGRDIYFTLNQWKDDNTIGDLTGIGWQYMPWEKIFAKLGLVDWNTIVWPGTIPDGAPAFVQRWKPAAHHYKKVTDPSTGIESFDKIAQMAKPAASTAPYYSPSETFRTDHGCEDRMNIARDSIKELTKMMLANPSIECHVSLVDFAGGSVAKQTLDFTNDFGQVESFLNHTEGYDYTHYDLGLTYAAQRITAHYRDNAPPCDNPLYVVFTSDGLPDYTDTGAGESKVTNAVAELHAATKIVTDRPDILGVDKGVEMYAAGICVSEDATGWGGKSAIEWLEAITGNASNAENCQSVVEFESFTSNILSAASKDLTATLVDKIGADFNFICDATHPITLNDYFKGSTEAYYRFIDLPDYIKVDAQKRTITLDVKKLSVYTDTTESALAGMRLDFYTKMTDAALNADKAAPGATARYYTNEGQATLTYLDQFDVVQTITMPPPYVELIKPASGRENPNTGVRSKRRR